MNVQKIFESIAPAMIDLYKVMYPTGAAPEGMTFMYSNFTPRNAKYAKRFYESHGAHGPIYEGVGYNPDNNDVDRMLVVGLTAALADLKQVWDDFFALPAQDVKAAARAYMLNVLGNQGQTEKVIDMWVRLHKMGHLPVEIRTLPEGSRVDMKVPFLTVHSTNPEFAFLTNYIESALSADVWKSSVTASTAFEFRKMVEVYAQRTCENNDHVPYQCHDFSMRGMSGVKDAMNSGIGHLACFKGTDSLPAIGKVRAVYSTDADDVIGCSVPATEHALMCLYGKENELETYRHLIEDVYPEGPVSIVSDTWDYWSVITEKMVALKDKILARNGFVCLRPDSGLPEHIVCGDPNAPEGSPERKGSIECLWEIFGGKVNSKGFKELDPHIRLIYGDSITLERGEAILKALAEKGFASNNIVLGIGSFTYQMVTRDTFSVAGKSTFAIVNGEERHLIKDPKTDPGKKSATGLLMVTRREPHTRYQRDTGGFDLVENVDMDVWKSAAREHDSKPDMLTTDIWDGLKESGVGPSFIVVRNMVDSHVTKFMVDCELDESKRG